MTDQAAPLREAFFFDSERLADLADRYHDQYADAEPFPHVVLDDFVPSEVIDEVLAEFPKPDDAVDWQVLEHEGERKLALAADRRMGVFTRQLLAEFNSSTFTTFLESLTGIEGLIPDPHFVGGGLHQINPGGFLKIHADFNKHARLKLDRRLNLLLYLNRDWQDAYGGELQLWDRDMTHCVESVLPIAGRCVIFSTTDFSYHGHPDPLRSPEGMTRKSLAFYYYSNGRPADEASRAHTTLFRARPNESGEKVRTSTREVAQMFVPPVVVESARLVRRRIRERRGGAD
jgi:Rps23 Pro-64 3,4-dihydroxylase Tpa1-like proline 4-hydroxylase